VKKLSGRTRSAFADAVARLSAHWSVLALIFATAQFHANRRAPAARSSIPAWTLVTSRRTLTAPWLTQAMVPAGSDSSGHPVSH
jgi:hypothetical protein